jgi:hypothetical protein
VLDWHSELTMPHSIKGNALQTLSGRRAITACQGRPKMLSNSRQAAYPELKAAFYFFAI